MKLITRRILFCFCFILFLVSSPLVILYAFGYRYDFTQKKITQTGIIYLTPNIQDNIKILINNKEELKNITIKGIFKKEFVLFDLVPKTYNIKIEKDNYHSWEKNLVVLPGLITYAQPLLLPSNPKTSLIFGDANVLSWTISDTFKKIFYLKNDAEKISANTYDFSKKTSNTIPIETISGNADKTSITAENSDIFYAPDGKKFAVILLQKTTRIILLNSAETNISAIGDFVSGDKIIDEYWDNTSRYFLYLNEKGELYSFDTASEKSNMIFENIMAFSLKDGNIYYLNKNNLLFYRTSINNPIEKQQLSYAPLAIAQENNIPDKTGQPDIEQKSILIISSKNTFAVITPEKDLFIIPQNNTPAKLGSNIEAAAFSKNGENILFNSSFEIFTSLANGSQENLITRLSQKISNVSWYSDYAHIWFLTNQTIKNIELDSRPTPNIIDFIDIPKKPAEIIYTDANYIYYDQLENNNLSLYQVEIQK